MMEIVDGKVSEIRPDSVIAAEVRAELTEALKLVCSIMEKARDAGMSVNFQLGIDAYGRQRVTSLDILKPL